MNTPQVGDVWRQHATNARLAVMRVGNKVKYRDAANGITGYVPVAYFQSMATLIERDGKQVQ